MSWRGKIGSILSDGYGELGVISCLVKRPPVNKLNGDILGSQCSVDKPYCDTLRSQFSADQVLPLSTDLLAPKFVLKAN